MGRASVIAACLAASILCFTWVAEATEHGVQGRTLEATAVEQAPELSEGTFAFGDIEVHYQMMDAHPAANDPTQAPPTVLFLHGAKYTSDVWVKLGTLKQAWAAGYTAIAVDIPGFGKTKHLAYVDNNMRAEFVKASLQFAMRGSNTSSILVSPSMSGKWAIPFLDRHGLMLAGWLGIAPAGVNEWGGPWEYTHRRVHMWAMYGSDDPMIKDGEGLIRLFSTSRKVVIPNAGHACYIDRTPEFHAKLKEFLKSCLPDIKPRNLRKEDGMET